MAQGTAVSGLSDLRGRQKVRGACSVGLLKKTRCVTGTLALAILCRGLHAIPVAGLYHVSVPPFHV